jgi:hypothetical protein
MAMALVARGQFKHWRRSVEFHPNTRIDRPDIQDQTISFPSAT